MHLVGLSRKAYDALPAETALLPVLAVVAAFILLAPGLLQKVWRHYERPVARLNPKKRFEWLMYNRVNDFVAHSREMLQLGKERYPNQPYKLYGDSGDVIIIPRAYIKEIGSDRSLNFMHMFNKETHSTLPGFETFRVRDEVPRIINKYLTHQMTRLTKPLSREADIALERVLTNDTDWHPIEVRGDMMSVVSQMSTRIFMGEELCRDQDWVKASTAYTQLAFPTTDGLRLYPEFLVPYLHWFLPECKEVRRRLNLARRVLQPYLAKRASAKARSALVQGGKPTVRFDDSLEWFEQELPAGTHDPATLQINLSMIAIHTTSDLLASVMIDLSTHPEVVEALRQEVCNVLQSGEMNKASLANLKLMDSVIKESQRLKPIRLSTCERLVEKDTVLSSGFKLYKGEKILVDVTGFRDESVYADAQHFDGYRFLRMRETAGQDKHAHLVSTSEHMFAFGHGMHTCPGRFFAANELKVALCHLVTKYEWRLRDHVDDLQPAAFGMNLMPDPRAALEIRRRADTMDLSFLGSE